MDREHIVHRDHFQIVFRDSGVLWEQLLVKLKLLQRQCYNIMANVEIQLNTNNY